MRVLRISHSAVVDAWRERERELIRRGLDVTLISARKWDEGGRSTPLSPGPDLFASGARTFGTHPNLFLYDPRPLLGALRNGNIDIVDIHEEPYSLAAAEVLLLIFLLRLHPPVILYSAQNIDKRFPAPFRQLERIALRSAAGVSVCNHEAGQILRRKGFRGALSVVPLGVDLGQFSPRDRPAPQGRLRVGYVGRLASHKGVRVLVDAVAARPNTTLDLFGDGPERRALADYVSELGITDRVHFLGYTSQHELPTAYRSLDVLAVPSVPTPSWREQFCRVAVEAMASGVPVVASETGALPEVIGDAGIFVPPSNPDALARALDLLATDSERWMSMREVGLHRCARYSWSAVGAAQHRLYRDVTRLRLDQRDAWFDGPDDLPDVNVVVVAYGAPELMERCLGPLARTFPIIVVDNSSSDRTRRIVEGVGGHYLDPGRNLGFAAGVNLALEHCPPGADVLLLNPDAKIDADGVQELQRCLHADPLLACVAPDQYNPHDDSAARVAWPFPSPLGAWIDAIGIGRFRRRVGFVIGAVLLLRAEALKEVGRFDERFFLYAEETDWQRRARQLGFRVVVASGVVATHEAAGTGGDPVRRETYFHASHELYLRKHYGALGWQAFRAGVVAGAAVRACTLRAARRRRAAARLRLYLSGPVRAQTRLGTGR